MAEKKTFYMGTGRRKTAGARVRLTDGKGEITINGRTLDNFFTEEKDRGAVRGPLLVTEIANRIDVIVKVHGGGITGQAGAVCQGVARAIKAMFAPADERQVFTRNNISMVRSYKAEAKPGTVLNPSQPVASTGEPQDEATIGVVKKLRDSGYLTRDSRMKERKKYGLRGARRGTQFSKR